MEKSKNAIVLLTRLPNEVWLNFLQNFKKYDVYVCIDCTKKNYAKLYEGSNITFIQMEDRYSKYFGYHNALIRTPRIPDKPLAWDKALLYFCMIRREKYAHVWFIEDDVFFLKEEVLLKMDTGKDTKDTDVLTPFHDINETGEMNGWGHWNTVAGKMPIPWARSMVCACRLSRKLLTHVRDYVKRWKTLVYHEAMFNTLALHHGLVVKCPVEMNTIHFCTTWKEQDMRMDWMYHPIKDYQVHNRLRMRNYVYFDNYFNRFRKENAPALVFHGDTFLWEHNPLPEDFNFQAYRKYNNMETWSDESIRSHWMEHGQFEGRKYK